MSIKRTRSFPARLAEAASVLSFVESVAAGLDDRLVVRLRLAAEELFVNTVIHGHGGDCDATVDVTICIDGDRVVLIHEDTAPPFDPFARVERPDVEAAVEARDVGRLGVFLVTQVAAECRYQRVGDRNCVTVELPLTRSGRDDPPPA